MNISLRASSTVVVAVILMTSVHAAAPNRRTPVQTTSLNSTHELIGPLGRPLGEMLTVTATVNDGFDKGYGEVAMITSVDGRPLLQPVPMQIDFLEEGRDGKLVAGERLMLRAFQDGGMRGYPDKAMKESGQFGQNTPYGFYTRLVVISEANRR